MFRKPHILRRYSKPLSKDGYSFSNKATDQIVFADIQTIEADTETGSDGDMSRQRVKFFSDSEIRMADKGTGTKADLVWYQGKWYECRSASYSGNTILRHWIGEFSECQNQEAPPSEELLIEVVT